MPRSTADLRRRRRLPALVVLLVLVPGCGHARPQAAGRPPHRHQRDVPARSALPEAPRAEAMLDRLVVQRRPRGTRGYVRSAFGSGWVDTDHDGCNQRDDVLLRDAVAGTTTVRHQGACAHDVLAGTWDDPYTGRTLRFTDLASLRQAEAIQIDHVVPLAEAWVSGAMTWSTSRRERFADDLDELLAVDGPTNMAKGDHDPAAWRPREAYWCAYARRWILVKARYRLAVDPAERAALHQLLRSCR